jgi:ubiquinone/menaquinone biosynthesis C-methylase UbiE
LSITSGSGYYPNIVLDVCAGPATFTLALINSIGLEAVQDISFTVTDFSSNLVDAGKVAMEEILPNHSKLSFQVVDVQNIPFSSDSYNSVACMFGYFVPDRMKAFSEISRVLKPDGVGIIGTWKQTGVMHLRDHFFRFIGHIGQHETSEHFRLAHACCEPEKLRSELMESGFKSVVIHELSESFEVPFNFALVEKWFNNVSIRPDLLLLSHQEVFSVWSRTVTECDAVKGVDVLNEVILVEYVALVCFESK